MYCVWRNKGNATVGKCIIISCAVSLYCCCKNREIIMAAICDMVLGRLADRDISFESFMIE